MDRYGATSDDPRIDPTFSLEGYADPARIIGPIRAITTIPTVVTGPFSIGADTGCANALFRVTGAAAYATVLYSTGQPIYFIGPSTVVLDSGIFKPASAGGITLGTAAVPWGITTISSSGALVTDLATLRIRADHSIKEQLLFED